MGVDEGNLQVINKLNVDVILENYSITIAILNLLLVYSTIQYNTVQYHNDSNNIILYDSIIVSSNIYC